MTEHLWALGPTRTAVPLRPWWHHVGGTGWVFGWVCAHLLQRMGRAKQPGMGCGHGITCGRWQLQSGLVVAGKCISSCWDYWEVPVARAEGGWMSHLEHPHSFTFLERENQLTLAAQLFVNWVHIVKISMSTGERVGTGATQN